ncbi:MAG: hypothetical protein PF503_17885 [Desulfobacula sp.]|jgi:hypothetical protein|nr:hypothetical protein [Desulfobacula sp.]
MDKKNKKTWTKPELIIINRCYVEENVLANCNESTNQACDAQSYVDTRS